jgi:hypothetical protein
MATFRVIAGESIDLDAVERFRPWSIAKDYKPGNARGGNAAAEMRRKQATISQNQNTTWVTFQGGRELQLRIPHDQFQQIMKSHTDGTTMDDLKRQVAEALLPLLAKDERRELESEGGLTTKLIADTTGIDPDLVAAALEGFEITLFGDGGIGWKKPQTVQRMKAFLHTKTTTVPVSNTYNTINNHGNNIQAAAGGDVTGTMNVTITYELVLHQLMRDVEASNLPPEKKKGVVDAVKGLLKEGAVQGMKVVVGDLVKAAYAHSGGVAALAEQVGKVL